MAPRFDQRRRIKKRKLQPAGESVGIPAGGHRNWADLPALPLISILDRLFLFSDLFAFGGVCSSWRSLFLNSAGKDALRCRPPLLLRPISKLQRPTTRTCKYKWKKPARCQLTYPSPADPPPVVPYRCMIFSSALSSCFCIGSSFGNLILVDRFRQIIIADVFTGDEIMSPELPHIAQSYHRGFLTAPPSSPDCRLILSVTVSPLFMWRVGADDWSEHLRLPPIEQLLLFKHRVYALDCTRQIHCLHFSPQLSFELLEGAGPPPSSLSLVAQLVECGDELLYVSLDYSTDDMSELKFNVLRLDFSKKVWITLKDLGDWSLFIDACGRSPLSCIRSTGWGGRSNCVYFAGSDSNSWSVHPLDEVLLYDNISSGSPFFLANTGNPFWPIWVYPSLFSK